MSSYKDITAETIFALATPPGRSAIAIIRLSGSSALDALDLFHVKPSYNREMRFVRLRLDDGSVLDEVMCLSFPAANSPTGEAVLEIHCHGSPAVIAAITDTLSKADRYRPAAAGEFSRRALDNGKMTLSEVEGLADLIDADTESQRRQASRQISGVLHKAAQDWRLSLIALNAELAAVIDFADEELPSSILDRLQQTSSRLLSTLRQHLDDGHVGEIIRDGVEIALIGPVNAGKSTTLNALAKRPAAIISDQAGTTRDVIEVRLDIAGISVSVRDTAGYRETDDVVEREGILRAKAAAESAHLVIIVLDISDPDWQKQYQALLAWGVADHIVIANKADKLDTQIQDLPEQALLLALGGANADSDISKLEAYLWQSLSYLQSAEEAPLITRARHRHAIETALSALTQALSLDVISTPELVAEEYRRAADALGRLTGDVDIEDLLDHIFTAFCIGK